MPLAGKPEETGAAGDFDHAFHAQHRGHAERTPRGACARLQQSLQRNQCRRPDNPTRRQEPEIIFTAVHVDEIGLPRREQLARHIESRPVVRPPRETPGQPKHNVPHAIGHEIAFQFLPALRHHHPVRINRGFGVLEQFDLPRTLDRHFAPEMLIDLRENRGAAPRDSEPPTRVCRIRSHG